VAKRILAVDDNEDLLTLLADVLGDEGYDVVTCGRSREAYGLAKDTRPDLVLLDVLMPGMNGWEVLNVFLLDREMCAIPIVLMTAAAADARKRLSRVGVYSITILDKPFSIDLLLERIDAALGKPSECERLYERLTSLADPVSPVVAQPRPAPLPARFPRPAERSAQGEQ